MYTCYVTLLSNLHENRKLLFLLRNYNYGDLISGFSGCVLTKILVPSYPNTYPWNCIHRTYITLQMYEHKKFIIISFGSFLNNKYKLATSFYMSELSQPRKIVNVFSIRVDTSNIHKYETQVLYTMEILYLNVKFNPQ